MKNLLSAAIPTYLENLSKLLKGFDTKTDTVLDNDEDNKGGEIRYSISITFGGNQKFSIEKSRTHLTVIGLGYKLFISIESPEKNQFDESVSKFLTVMDAFLNKHAQIIIKSKEEHQIRNVQEAFAKMNNLGKKKDNKHANP